MEQSLFIYTRVKYFDYRLIYTPNNQFIQSDIKWEFINFAREVIDEDNVLNGDILVPRWSLFKINNYLLWGIGCRNSFLNQNAFDYTGTPIRGFFGQIIKLPSTNEAMISFSLDFYKEIYLQKIIPIFESRKEGEVNSIESNWIPNGDLTYITSQKTSLSLNNRNDITRIFSIDSNMQELVSAALAYSKINIVYGLNNEGHILNTDLSHLNNVTIIGQKSQKDLFRKKNNESQKQLVNNETTIDSKVKQNNEAKQVKQKTLWQKTKGFIGHMNNKTNAHNLENLKGKQMQISKNQEKEYDNTDTPPLHSIAIIKSNRNNIRNIVEQYNNSESNGEFDKSLLTDKDNKVDKSKNTLQGDNMLNSDESVESSSRNYSSNYSSERKTNNYNTNKEQPLTDSGMSLLDESQAIIDAYNAKNRKLDDDIVQLKILLIKIKSEKDYLDNYTKDLIETLVSKL